MYVNGHEVRFTFHDFMLAAQTGACRNAEAIVKKRKDRHGCKGPGWDQHIEGAAGEMAVCAVMGLFWHPTVGTFKDADIGTVVQVRTRSSHDYDLIIRDDDNEDHVYVLVTGQRGTYRVRGWIVGKDAKRDEWFGAKEKTREDCWWVPQNALVPMSELRLTTANMEHVA